MSRKTGDYFVFSAAVILFVTAAATVFSATGSAGTLAYHDPLIPLANRQVFLLAGGLELLISAFLSMNYENQRINLALIAWLAENENYQIILS